MKRLSKQSKLASTRQRAMILLASNTLMGALEIARMLTDESQVRKVIHDFNLRGFESLRPRLGGGRPRRISTDDDQRIVAVAGARPDTLGVPPYTRWSLAKLSRYLRGQGIEISPAHLASILARNGISLQRTRSWKLAVLVERTRSLLIASSPLPNRRTRRNWERVASPRWCS